MSKCAQLLRIHFALAGFALCAIAVPAQGVAPQTGQAATNAPLQGTGTVPSTVIAAPASILRIYVGNLNGTDAAALTGLVVQALFESKQVVVTENQANASLTLQGTIERKPVVAAAPVRRRPAHDDGTAADPTALPSMPDSSAAVLNSDPLLAATTVDLNKYLYRLDLQLTNTSGDLVWLSGQGREALPFMNADEAAARTLQPMLDLLAKLAPAGRVP